VVNDGFNAADGAIERDRNCRLIVVSGRTISSQGRDSGETMAGVTPARIRDARENAPRIVADIVEAIRSTDHYARAGFAQASEAGA